MTIRNALLTGVWLLLAIGAFAQGHRLGAEAASAKDGHAQHQRPQHVVPEEMPIQGYSAVAPEAFHAEILPPAPPQPLRFWEDILPVCLVIAGIWLAFLILGLTLTSSIASGIFLLLAAWTALFGVGALLLAILALVQISSRSERKARRAHDPFWRLKRWRSR